MLLLLARSVGGTNQGLAIYCQPMLGMVSFKMQGLYLLDDCFFWGLRTSLFYCPIACHSLIQPVGLRMREGEPGCVDLGLGCREHMEVDWIGMKWDSFPCRKTNSEMKVSCDRYPKSSSCGWPWLRRRHGELGLPHELRTPQRVGKDSWWPAGRSQANGTPRKVPGGDLVILPRQSAEIDPFHSFKVTGQENTI